MEPNVRRELSDYGLISRSRSTSISSDSQISRTSLLSPPPVFPAPAFVSSSAASEFISANQEYSAVGSADDEEGSDIDDNALVTPGALSLLNGFLDHLLFNILAAAKSTKLGCIRPALADVLRPRFAKQVISAVDDELSDYIDDLDGNREFKNNSRKCARGFDLIRAWKLARLRCMVYTRLGDLEEDDEREYILNDGLGETDGFPGKFASSIDIAPATAVFLTSVIEYIGEQALTLAGKASRARLSARDSIDLKELEKSATEWSNRLVVEDADMERLALNSTLGRLWRTWRRRVRPAKLSRTLSRESIRPRSYHPVFDLSRKSSDTASRDAVDPSSIPLPPSPIIEPQQQAEHKFQQQVDHLAVAPQNSKDDAKGSRLSGWSADGRSFDNDLEIVTMEAVVAHKMRPRSLMVFSSSPTSDTPRKTSLSTVESLPKTIRHVRSKSLPGDSFTSQNLSSKKHGPPYRRSSVDQGRPATTYEREAPTESVQHESGIATPVQNGMQDSGSKEADNVQKETPSSEANYAGRAISVETATNGTEPTRPSLNGQQKEDRKDEPSRVSSHESFQEDRSYSGNVGKCRPSNKRPHPPLLQIPGTTQRQPANDRKLPAATSDSNTQQAINSATSTVCQDIDQRSKGIRTTTSPHSVPLSPRNVGTATSTHDDGNSKPSPSLTKKVPSKLSNGSQHSHQSSSPAVSVRTDRAAVRRLSGQTTLSMASSNRSGSRGSDSFNGNLDRRPITSGPPASPVREKLKGLINRSQGDPASPDLRASYDTVRVSEGTVCSDDTSTLDDLIRSDETIHFTLTPRNVREMEEPENLNSRTCRSTTSELAEFLKETSPPGEEPPRQKSPVSSKLSTKETNTAPLPDVKFMPANASNRNTVVVANSGPPPRRRQSQYQPRDARPIAESTFGIAEFIRSTGPGDSANGPSSQKNVTKPPTGRRASDTPVAPRRRDTTKSIGPGSQLQARSATPMAGGQTPDLIDFIRNGPSVAGGNRIPSSVAPFSDSDRTGSLKSSSGTQGRMSTANSSRSSFGSNAALLGSADGTNSQSGPSRKTSPVPVGISRRLSKSANRQLQARDPCTVDREEEEEEDDELDAILGMPMKSKRRGESMIDFLKNVPPPEDMGKSSQRPPVSSPPTKSIPPKSRGSADGPRTPRNQTPPMQTSRTSLRSPNNANSVSGQSSYSVKVGIERNPGTPVPPSVPRSGYSQAPAAKIQTETSALADFLKNTGPPEPQPLPRTASTNLGRPKESAFSKFFSRRRKVEV